MKFTISSEYDYSVSTEENYRSDEIMFVGKYRRQRKKLDYSYHRHYLASRQRLHDEIIDKYSQVEIDDGVYTCEVPEENWLVFTAGPMGVGKSHALRHLHDRGVFPLKAFVYIDPDELRMNLPEFKGYNDRDPATAGKLTQKEVGYLSEVMTLNALEEGKNALVDGSLRDKEWYDSYISKLKQLFPKLKIAIIQITASKENVLMRAVKRAETTGRHVPEHVILSAMNDVPASVEALQRYADFTAIFNNDEAPRLVRSSSGLQSLDEFKDVWKMTCRLNQPNIRLGSKRSVSESYDEYSPGGSDSESSRDHHPSRKNSYLGIEELFGTADPLDTISCANPQEPTLLALP